MNQNETKLNNLPDGWKWVKLGEVAEITSSKRIFQDDYVSDGIPFYRTKEIKELSEGKEISIELFITKEKYDSIKSQYEIPKINDILISAVGTIGVSYIIKDDKPFYFKDGNLIWIRKINHANSKFINYLLEHFIRFKQNISTSGSAYNALTIIKLKDFEIPLPPLSIQAQIVEKLETLLSELDKGKAQLLTAQAQLKTYRQAVLKYAFEGKLTGEWRNENKEIKTAFQFLQEVSEIRKKRFFENKKNREKKIEKNYDFEFYKSDEIDSWANATLDKLIYIAGRIGWRGLTKDEYKTEGPLFLSVHSLNYGKYVEFKDAYHISEERYLESPEIILKKDDILLCKDGAGIGKIGIIKNLPSEGSVNSSLLIIRGLEIFTPDFLYYLLSGPKLQSIVKERITGSATPHLFQNDIRKFELLIPPLEEQQKIVQEIESRLSVCDKLEETIKASLLQCETLRQSVLKRAFEGKLV